jgi:hypothetical protein
MLHLESAPAPPTARLTPRRMYVEPREPWSETRWRPPTEHVLQATVDVSLLVDAGAVGVGPGTDGPCPVALTSGRAATLRRGAVPRGTSLRVDGRPTACSTWNLAVGAGQAAAQHGVPARKSRVDVLLLHVGGGVEARVTTTGVPGGPDEGSSDDPAPQAVVPRGTCRQSRPPSHSGGSTWNLPPLWNRCPTRDVPGGTCRRSGPPSHAGCSTWNLPLAAGTPVIPRGPAAALDRRGMPVVPRGTSATSSETRPAVDHGASPRATRR